MKTDPGPGRARARDADDGGISAKEYYNGEYNQSVAALDARRRIRRSGDHVKSRF